MFSEGELDGLRQDRTAHRSRDPHRERGAQITFPPKCFSPKLEGQMCTDRNQVRPSITLWQVLGFWGHAAMSPNPLFVSSSECDPGIP